MKELYKKPKNANDKKDNFNSFLVLYRVPHTAEDGPAKGRPKKTTTECSTSGCHMKFGNGNLRLDLRILEQIPKKDSDYRYHTLHFCPKPGCFLNPKSDHVSQRIMPKLHARSPVLIDPTTTIADAEKPFLSTLNFLTFLCLH